MNDCFFTGNLTRDPEVKFSKAGKTWAKFSLAVPRPGTPKNEEEATDFLDFKVFGGWASELEKAVKGDRLLVQATATVETWETEAGDKRRATVFVARTLHRVARSPKREGNDRRPPRDGDDEGGF